MADNTHRRNIIIAIVVLLVIAIVLMLTRCLPKKPTVTAQRTVTPTVSPDSNAPIPRTNAPDDQVPEEALTPATVTAPERVTAGAAFSITWTGPNNPGDYVTIVRTDAPANTSGNYRETSTGSVLELTAPIEPGPHEVRYVTGRSHAILGRAAVEIVAVGATLDAAAEVVLGSPLSVMWTGPNNRGDYITIVPKDWPDEKYGNYTNTEKGSPLTLTAPTETGEVELRYVTGQGHKVLARRAIRIIAAEVILSAPAEAAAGSTIQVTWQGPNNAGDYVTVVSKDRSDGQYGNYTNTSTGSPLTLLIPIMIGDAELRYMTGQGNKVLARRAIRINAAAITLSAPAEIPANTDVPITWTGPNHPGDYITIVSKITPDGQYAAYTVTATGSPLNVKSPKEVGDAEVRYMSGQGSKVLARIPIKVVP